MTNDTEARVREALQALARDGGAPDETAAWERVTAEIRADRPSAGRRRALLAVAGLALAGSAAAVVAVVVNDGSTPQSVRVVSPADPPTTDERPVDRTADDTTVDPTTAPTVGDTTVDDTTVDPTVDESLPADSGVVPTSGPVPAHPLAVVLATEQSPGIAVHDGDTGELLGMPVGRTYHGYDDVSFAPDGTLWFAEEFGDTHAVTTVAWGSTTKETPFGTESRAPAVSPDGTTVAYLHSGVTVERPSVRFVDLGTGQQTAELFWREDDPDWFHTRGSITSMEWSPDGSRLLFVSSYEGSEVLVIDPAAESLSDATPLVAADAWDGHWAGTDAVVVIDQCCYPDHENNAVVVHDLRTGRESTPALEGAPLAVGARSDGTVAVLTDDGVLHLLGGPSFEFPGAEDFGF